MPRLVDWDPQPLHEKPLGGFVACHGSVVLAVWELSRSVGSQLVSRTFFALTETAARRRASTGEPVHAEVLKLLGLSNTPKNLTRVRAAVRLLVEKGLVLRSGGGVKPATHRQFRKSSLESMHQRQARNPHSTPDHSLALPGNRSGDRNGPGHLFSVPPQLPQELHPLREGSVQLDCPHLRREPRQRGPGQTATDCLRVDTPSPDSSSRAATMGNQNPGQPRME